MAAEGVNSRDRSLMDTKHCGGKWLNPTDIRDLAAGPKEHGIRVSIVEGGRT